MSGKRARTDDGDTIHPKRLRITPDTFVQLVFEQASIQHREFHSLRSLTRIAHFRELTLATSGTMPELRVNDDRQTFNLLLRVAENSSATQIDVNNAPALLELVHKYNEIGIIDLCHAQIVENFAHSDLTMKESIAEQLGRRLTLDNVHQVLHIALRFKQSKLMQRCELYIREHEEAVVTSIGRADSSYTWSTVDFICSLDNLAGSEATLITAILNWARNQAASTGGSASVVLGTIVTRFRLKSVTLAEMRILSRDFRDVIGLYIGRIFNMIQIPHYTDHELSNQFRILPFVLNRLVNDDDDIDDEPYDTDDDLYIDGTTETTSCTVNRKVKLLSVNLQSISV